MQDVTLYNNNDDDDERGKEKERPDKNNGELGRRDVSMRDKLTRRGEAARQARRGVVWRFVIVPWRGDAR